MFTLHKKLFIYLLFFTSIISAMDTPQTDAVPQDITRATPSNDIKILEANIVLMNEAFTFLASLDTAPFAEKMQEGNALLKKLKDSPQRNGFSLTPSHDALASLLARTAALEEKIKLDQENILKDMQKRAEASKRQQKERERQDLENMQNTLITVEKTAIGAIQNAYSDIERINEELPKVQARLKLAQEDRDNHDQKLPYMLGGILLIIISSIYACKLLMPQ
jgi:hypothetical protein